MKLLLIQQNEKLRDQWCDGLRKCGYSVDVCSSLADAAELCYMKYYHLIIIDINEAELSAIASKYLKELYDSNPTAQKLLVTEPNAIALRVKLQTIGISDYLIKPILFSELASRVRALLRLSQLSFEKLSFGKLLLDPLLLQVYSEDTRLGISKKEYLLLEFLLRNHGRVVRHDQLARQISEVQSKACIDEVCRLLSKLVVTLEAEFSEFVKIENVRDIGYRIEILA